MEENFNSDPNGAKDVKTSSTDSKENSKTTGDSQVQDGTEVLRPEEQEKSYEKSDEQQEYLEDANNNTKVANEAPVKDGNTLSMSAFIGTVQNNGDDDDEADEDGDTDLEIGDDFDETKKKIPVF